METPIKVDTTANTAGASEKARSEEIQGLRKPDRQDLDSRLELAKREIEQLKARTELLNLRIQELEETRSKVTEIKNLLAELPDEGWEEIRGWLQKQLRDRQVIVNLDRSSTRVEQEVVFPLKIKLRLLIDSLGEGHPSVAVLRKQLERAMQEVEALRERELSQ